MPLKSFTNLKIPRLRSQWSKASTKDSDTFGSTSELNNRPTALQEDIENMAYSGVFEPQIPQPQFTQRGHRVQKPLSQSNLTNSDPPFRCRVDAHVPFPQFEQDIIDFENAYAMSQQQQQYDAQPKSGPPPGSTHRSRSLFPSSGTPPSGQPLRGQPLLVDLTGQQFPAFQNSTTPVLGYPPTQGFQSPPHPLRRRENFTFPRVGEEPHLGIPPSPEAQRDVSFDPMAHGSLSQSRPSRRHTSTSRSRRYTNRDLSTTTTSDSSYPSTAESRGRSGRRGDRYEPRHGSRGYSLGPRPDENHDGSTQERILFYDERKPHYGFSNSSPFPVVYKGKRYPTGEHLYHALKFEHHRPDLSEYLRTCSPKPKVVISESRRYEPQVRSDWQSVKIRKMEEILLLKFEQQRELREELLDTRDAELVEASYNDSFWGIGANGVGRNEFGKALQRVRDQLRTSRRRRDSSHRSRTRDARPHDSHRSRVPRQIYFFHKGQPHYAFNNFSPYNVVHNGKRYPTAQHLFQSLKFLPHAPDVADHIRECSTYPDIATAEAHRHRRDVRKDWKSVCVTLMEETLWHKFSQHPDLERELSDTGDAQLIFDAREDSVWGSGADGRGRNEVGKALERVRLRLRTEERYRPRRDTIGVPTERPAHEGHRRGTSLTNMVSSIFGGGRRNPGHRVTFYQPSSDTTQSSSSSAFSGPFKGTIYSPSSSDYSYQTEGQRTTRMERPGGHSKSRRANSEVRGSSDRSRWR